MCSRDKLDDIAPFWYLLTVFTEVILGVAVIISCFVALGEGITWQFHPNLEALFVIASVNGAIQLVILALDFIGFVKETNDYVKCIFAFFRLIGTVTMLSLSIASMFYIPDM